MGPEEAHDVEIGPRVLYFVIFRRTGVGILSRTFSSGKNGKEIQETLFSGLLSGIMTFADEMIGGQISSFKIEDKYIILEGTSSDIVFCLVTTRDDPLVRQLLFDIEKHFQLRFGELSQLGFEFEERVLESFGLELDKMVEIWEKEVTQSALIRGLAFFFFENQKHQNLACETSLAFLIAWMRRRSVKTGLFKKKQECMVRIVRLLLPCYLVPIEGLGFAIASPFFFDQSDLRIVDFNSLERLYKEIDDKKDTVSLLKEAAFQVVLPRVRIETKVADFSFRMDFKSAIGALMPIPSWNSTKLPVREERDFAENIATSLKNALQIHSRVRSLLKDSQTRISNRFKEYEKEMKNEILQLEEKFRREREKLSKEVDAKVASLLKEQKQKSAEYIRHQRELGDQITKKRLSALEREIDQLIETEEGRLIKHDQNRKNVIETLEAQLEDARRLLRNLDSWSEQATKMTNELDKDIEASLIPPKQLMDIFRENTADETRKDKIGGIIQIFIPFYVATYSTNGKTREEVIAPGRPSKEGNRLRYAPWQGIYEQICSAWEQVSRDIELVRNLDKTNIIRDPDARNIILDGFRRLKDDVKLIDEKTYENLVKGCRWTFQLDS
ncbi:MAG: hypothetical protein ACFFB3_20975 [Candidatus Hodarchaeota archaeon]